MTVRETNQLALENYERAVRKAGWRDRISRLTRKDNNLLALDEVRKLMPHQGQHYLGLQTVAIEKIVGSEGRQRDFDRAFYPRQTQTRDRWIRVDEAHHRQVPLPPVELLKVGEVYFVRDGNHRVSVARAHGQDFIDAYVTGT